MIELKISSKEVFIMNLSRGLLLLFMLVLCISASGQAGTGNKEQILNNDYRVAERALDENVKRKDIKAICLSLKHRTLSIRRKAADAFGVIRAKESVSCLVEALEDLQSFIPFDTEAGVLKAELNSSLVRALAAITGLDLPTKKKLSDSEAQKIVSRVREWQKTHPGS